MGHERHHAYWQRFLLPGEKTMRTFGVSGLYVAVFWVVPTTLLFLLAILISCYNLVLGLMMLIPVVSMLIPILYMLFFVHYAITDRRVMGREGILYKRYVTVNFRSVTDVAVQESFLERLFTKTGTISINTAGGPAVELFFKHVRRPVKIRIDVLRHLQAAIEHRGQMEIPRPEDHKYT